MVVLNSDLELATEQGVITTPIPFYTKITIGRDPADVNSVETSGKSLGTQIYQQIAMDSTTSDFIDYIQIEAVRQYLAGTQDVDSFRTTVQTRKSPNNASDFEFTTSVEEYPVIFKTDTLNPALDATTLDEISNVSEDTNFILLRDFNREGNFQLHSTQINDAIAATAAERQSVQRKFSEILEGIKCHTEVLMYVIEKRRVIDGAPGPILQNFFISRKFNTNDVRPVVFYDTQVKYGQRYVYNIKKLVTVFGSYYRYQGLELAPLPGQGPTEEEFGDRLSPGDFGSGTSGAYEEVLMDDILSEGAEEQEDLQNRMGEQDLLAGQVADQIVNETLQNLAGQLGTTGMPGRFGTTGPVLTGPGALGRGPGGFGGSPRPPGGPNSQNLTFGADFGALEDIEESDF
jgi:hypothetical protein